jgi:hypothetical protein
MRERDFGNIVQLDAELGLDLPDDTLNDMAYVLYIGDENTDLDELSVDDVIGFTDCLYLGKGDCFSNPWDTSSYLEIVQLDEEFGIAVMQLRRD